ncbi:MAG: sulfurtransferase TusE [Thermodesulfovibrio sp. RBG_19FT_COMBO_42_12]|nr:MAG: sulfurtransferase TusE [Thermodesulfovibrio sp. RBG_19FT_COMBO_42_12]
MAMWMYDGREFDMDEDGFLTDWETWEEGMAVELAKTESVALDDRHWEVIKWLREYYVKYQIAPPIKMLVKEMAKLFGAEKGNTKYLYELFPGGPAKQACKFAGLPKPTGCV